MEQRILTNKELKEDSFEKSIRPESISEYVGQSEVKENIEIYILEDTQIERGLIDMIYKNLDNILKNITFQMS